MPLYTVITTAWSFRVRIGRTRGKARALYPKQQAIPCGVMPVVSNKKSVHHSYSVPDARATQGAQIPDMPYSEVDAYVRTEIARWMQTVEELGIALD